MAKRIQHRQKLHGLQKRVSQYAWGFANNLKKFKKV